MHQLFSQILILDEPTANLDQLATQNMQNVFQNLSNYITHNHVVIIIDHDFSFLVQTCNKILWLYNNQYFFGSPYELYYKYQEFRKMCIDNNISSKMLCR